MKTMLKWAVAVTMALSAASAADAASVKYDVDKSVDFSSRRQVAWRRSGPVLADSISEARIRRALEAELASKGYRFVERGEADLLIDFHAGARRDVRVNERFAPGFGRDLRVDAYPVGVLAVEFLDRATGRVVWHGVVSDALASNPEKADKKTEKAVAKLLEEFPPQAS